MRIHLLPTITLAVGLTAAGAAFAQDAKDQPGADQAKPAQAGAQEPGSQAPTRPPEQSPVLVDGRLNVPGAPENSDAVPAKFSAKNDADDHMITAGYTFKHLTPEQKKAIYQVVSAGGAKTANGDLPAKLAVVGATLPPLYPLTPFPALTTRQVDQAAKYHYTVVGDQLLLVEPVNMIVVGVIGPDAVK